MHGPPLLFIMTVVKDIVKKLEYGHKKIFTKTQHVTNYTILDIKIEREVLRDVVYEKYFLGSVRADIIVNNEYVIKMKIDK